MADRRSPSPRPGRPARPPVSPDVARWALILAFGINGLTLAAWVARMPALRDALELSPSELGRILLVAAVTGLITTAAIPRLVIRLGVARAVLYSGVLFAIAYLAFAVGIALGDPVIVTLALALNGATFAASNLPLNMAAAQVERAVGRPVIPQFHAGFSIGTVLGSLLAAGAAGVGIGLSGQLVAMALVAFWVRWWASSRFLPEPARALTADPQDGRDGARPARTFGLRDAWREPRTLLIGAIAFAAGVSELGANDWVALAMVDGFAAGQSFAAATLSVFVAAMTLVRLAGSRIIAGLGRATTLRLASVVAISGVTLFVLAPHPALAIVGAVAWGAGSALNFPIVGATAADDPERAAQRLTVMSVLASAAGIVSPLGLGNLAEAVGVRSAIAAIGVVLIVITLAAGAVRQVGRQRAASDAGSATIADGVGPASAEGGQPPGEVLAVDTDRPTVGAAANPRAA